MDHWARLAELNKIGGNTVAWEQFDKKEKYEEPENEHCLRCHSNGNNAVPLIDGLCHVCLSE